MRSEFENTEGDLIWSTVAGSTYFFNAVLQNTPNPQFMRLRQAEQGDDPALFARLVCDDSYWVRRKALKNPATPQWVLENLLRLGATSDLRGKGKVDPSLDAETIRKTVNLGPWACKLAAEHPNTPEDVLADIYRNLSPSLRSVVAGHPNTGEHTLTALCSDFDDVIRSKAAIHPSTSKDVKLLLESAGAETELDIVRQPDPHMDMGQLRTLAGFGPWALFLAVRHPECPDDMLRDALAHEDWRVRSGLLDNPAAPVNYLKEFVENCTLQDIEDLKQLGKRCPAPGSFTVLSQQCNPAIRLALARHPEIHQDVLILLTSDGIREIRKCASINPNLQTEELDLLVRAGSSRDLMQFEDPGAEISQTELDILSRRGLWAKQLVVRHPNTGSTILSRLICDTDPLIRQWAAMHPNTAKATLNNLIRAGCGDDLQGFSHADPDLGSDVLRQLSALGPWARRVVSMHPKLPQDLLQILVHADEWEVRRNLAMRSDIPYPLISQLAEDPVNAVREAVAKRKY